MQTQRLIKIIKNKKKCLLAILKLLEEYFNAGFFSCEFLFIYYFDRFETITVVVVVVAAADKSVTTFML